MIGLLLVLTAILWGATPILEKIGLTGKIDTLSALTIRSLAVSVALLIWILIKGKTQHVFNQEPKTYSIFILTGLMAGLFGMLTYFGALKMGATSKIVPIAATYPMVTAILSILILKEPVTFIRLFGTALIISGIWLVK